MKIESNGVCFCSLGTRLWKAGLQIALQIASWGQDRRRTRRKGFNMRRFLLFIFSLSRGWSALLFESDDPETLCIRKWNRAARRRLEDLVASWLRFFFLRLHEKFFHVAKLTSLSFVSLRSSAILPLPPLKGGEGQNGRASFVSFSTEAF